MAVLLTISGVQHLAKIVQVLIRLLKESLSAELKEVDNVVTAVKNWVYDAILLTIVSVVIPVVGMAVRSITESSRPEPNLYSVVQSLDQIDFPGSMDDTPLMMASSRTDLNVNQNSNDETLNSENLEDGDSPSSRSNFDWHPHTHHNSKFERHMR